MSLVRISLRIPERMFNRMKNLIETHQKWLTFSEFIREAIKEKIEREEEIGL